ncbi:EGF-like domain-containing protein [Pseudoscourfieldia marina]
MEERTRRLSTCWVPPVLLLLVGRLSSAVSTAEFPVRLQDNGTVSISAVAPSKELMVNAGASTADTLTVLGDVHATGGVFVNGEPAATNKNSMLITDVPVCHEPGTDAMLGLPTGGFECDCLEGWSGTTCDVSAQSVRGTITASFGATCKILSNNNKLKCWGYNYYGQLGYGDTTTRGDGPNQMGENLPYVDVGTGRTVKQISAGHQHTCAILDNDKLKCWGEGNYLGYGDTTTRGNGPNQMGENLPYIDVGTGRTVKQISLGGGTSTCAILDNDKLKCWGYNSDGQLGYGDTTRRGDGPNEMGDSLPYVDLGTGRTVKQISAGGSDTCALLDNDKVKCWGNNYAGALGYGDTNNRGDGPNEMGDNLPYVDLGTGRTAKQISLGGSATCAILDNDKVKCWGGNYYGQLGYCDTINRGDGPNEMGDNLPYVDVGTGRTVKQISVGQPCTCAILDNDKVKCWGMGRVLGYGDTNARGDLPNSMGDSLPYVDLGTGRTAVVLASLKMSPAGGHTCALLDNDAVKCWGENLFGFLGYGDSISRGDEPNEMGDNLPEVDLGSA